MKNEKNYEENSSFTIPKMQNFFKNKKKNTALTWIPVESALILDTKFQELRTPTKAIFLQLFLLCGVLGNCELPFNINYLARVLAVDRKRIRDSLGELFGTGLCVLNGTPREKERHKEQNRTDTQTHRQETSDEGVVCVDSKNSFQNDSDENNQSNGNGKGGQNKSLFSIEECFRYVEICQSKGEEIKNAKGLANHLFKTGESDAFILATLYPQQQAEIDLQKYGEPRQFTDEPCTVCLGAKMANTDGNGFRKCSHCRNEKGKATGLEPL